MCIRDRDSTIILKVEGEDSFEVSLSHTLTARQIDWFKAGSALNVIRDSLK